MTAKKKPKIKTCKYAVSVAYSMYGQPVCRWHEAHIVPACDTAGAGGGRSLFTSSGDCDECECWEPKRGKK
jgi:hypothetical protein